MRSLRSAASFTAAAILLSFAAAAARGQWWTVQTSGLDTNLRAVTAAYSPDAKGVRAVVAWAAGSNGVILRSLDEGKSWKRLHVPDSDALDFRGIAALDAAVAYVMSIGNGDKSRIYKTVDGGETWGLQFTGPRKEIFLDAIVCVSRTNCFVLGDPVDGKFLLMSTEDGEHWRDLSRANMPAALPDEGAFAASNSSLFVDGDDIYFGTGGAATARVFHSADSGKTWAVQDTPIAAGTVSSGIFSLNGRWRTTIFAVGGDYKDVSRSFHSASYLRANQNAWQSPKQLPGGFRSGVAVVDGLAVLAVGPTGEDISHDEGVTWEHTDSLNLNAVFILDEHHGWAVGPKGTIARFLNQKKYLVQSNAPTNDPGITAVAACPARPRSVH